MFRLGLLLVAFLMAACGGPRYVDFFPYYDDGQPKPRVILLPIVDNICGDKDFSGSLEQGLRYTAMNSGNLYILQDDEIPCDVRVLRGIDFFGNDLSFTKDMRTGEYVVIVEALENGFDINKALVLQKIRVRVIDLRYSTPVVVLQEVIQNDYRFPGKSKRQACQKLSSDTISRLEDVLRSIH